MPGTGQEDHLAPPPSRGRRGEALISPENGFATLCRTWQGGRWGHCPGPLGPPGRLLLAPMPGSGPGEGLAPSLPCCTSGVSGAAEDGDFTGILGSTHADMSLPGGSGCNRAGADP